jgi:hypothetical protein
MDLLDNNYHPEVQDSATWSEYIRKVNIEIKQKENRPNATACNVLDQNLNQKHTTFWQRRYLEDQFNNQQAREEKVLRGKITLALAVFVIGFIFIELQIHHVVLFAILLLFLLLC